MADEKTIQEEKTFIRSCISGDKASWDRFVEQYQDLVFDKIYRTLEDKGWTTESELVEDLYQGIFLKLHQDNYKKLKQCQWKNNCSFATWLSTLTRNFVIDFIRKESTRTKHLEPLVQQDDCDEDDEDNKLKENESKTIIKSAAPSDEAAKQERKELVHKALKELPEDDRELLIMLFFKGISPEDAAEILGKSVDAVYMRTKRAKDKMEKILKKYVGNEDL